jgi:hypothetical protein
VALPLVPAAAAAVVVELLLLLLSAGAAAGSDCRKSSKSPRPLLPLLLVLACRNMQQAAGANIQIRGNLWYSQRQQAHIVATRGERQG